MPVDSLNFISSSKKADYPARKRVIGFFAFNEHFVSDERPAIESQAAAVKS